jgi:ubiquinone/menaquinone biosynthesis C-methylase UbiE
VPRWADAQVDHTTHYKAAQAFDQIADDYDALYGAKGNASMGWMRAENVSILRQRLAPYSTLLELGCGTGEEAIALARDGHRILASDVSPQMARITHSKVVAAGLDDRVRVVALPAGGLDALRPKAQFDAAYSSFGVLNCEPRLSAVGRSLRRLIRPGGAAIIGVMNTTYLFELLWYLTHLQPRVAFRRWRGGWQYAPVAGRAGRTARVATRYLSRSDVLRVLGQGFQLQETMALPLFVPPPYAERLLGRSAPRLRVLAGLDRALRRRWPFSTLGDHVVLVLQRVSGDS